jgi:hypothetical protein
MKRNLYSRLAGLEKFQAQQNRAETFTAGLAKAQAAIEHVQQLLDTLETEQKPDESLAEAFARALRIDCRELGDRLCEAAAGGSFWKPDELAALSEGTREAKS